VLTAFLCDFAGGSKQLIAGMNVVQRGGFVVSGSCQYGVKVMELRRSMLERWSTCQPKSYYTGYVVL
jgi:hypothetical protein